MKPLHPIDELEELQHASSRRVVRDLDGLAVAILEYDDEARARHVAALAKEITEANRLADLFGRRRLLLEVDHRPVKFSVPFVPSQNAILDLISRDSRLAGSQEEVARIHTLEHGFVLARSAEEWVTERVQRAVGTILEGADVDAARKKIVRALRSQDSEKLEAAGISREGLSDAYADTVWRTNISTAYTAGRVEQARDPALSRIVGGWRFNAVGDSDTRPNHMAADGMIAALDDYVWDVMAPPSGFRCRCSLSSATPEEVERASKTPAQAFKDGAHPDVGFTPTPRAIPRSEGRRRGR